MIQPPDNCIFPANLSLDTIHSMAGDHHSLFYEHDMGGKQAGSSDACLGGLSDLGAIDLMLAGT